MPFSVELFSNFSEDGRQLSKYENEKNKGFIENNKSVKTLLEMAGKSNLNAQFHLAIIFENGLNGADVNKKSSFLWMKQAALNEKATSRMIYNYGRMLENSIGCEADYQEAINQYKKAADRGYAAAQCALGTMKINPDFNKKLKEKYFSESEKLFREAIAQKYIPAQYYLGLILILKCEYLNFEKKDKNEFLKTACDICNEAANEGYPPAQFICAYILESSETASDKIKNANMNKSIELYRKAIKGKHAGAANNLAMIFFEGRDQWGFRNQEESFALFSQAMK